MVEGVDGVRAIHHGVGAGDGEVRELDSPGYERATLLGPAAKGLRACRNDEEGERELTLMRASLLP